MHVNNDIFLSLSTHIEPSFYCLSYSVNNSSLIECLKVIFFLGGGGKGVAKGPPTIFFNLIWE